jgi:hypothetical protein
MVGREMNFVHLQAFEKRSEDGQLQGARSAGTGMYFMYMRIPSTAQRRR